MKNCERFRDNKDMPLYGLKYLTMHTFQVRNQFIFDLFGFEYFVDANNATFPYARKSVQNLLITYLNVTQFLDL